jgi:hypothetical protein
MSACFKDFELHAVDGNKGGLGEDIHPISPLFCHFEEAYRYLIN